MTINQWSGKKYPSNMSPLALLQEAHFKTFNAAESECAKRIRSQYQHGLRILESAFNYLYEQEV